jgi:hypothetical protein
MSQTLVNNLKCSEECYSCAEKDKWQRKMENAMELVQHDNTDSMLTTVLHPVDLIHQQCCWITQLHHRLNSPKSLHAIPGQVYAQTLQNSFAFTIWPEPTLSFLLDHQYPTCLADRDHSNPHHISPTTMTFSYSSPTSIIMLHDHTRQLLPSMCDKMPLQERGNWKLVPDRYETVGDPSSVRDRWPSTHAATTCVCPESTAK